MEEKLNYKDEEMLKIVPKNKKGVVYIVEEKIVDLLYQLLMKIQK